MGRLLKPGCVCARDYHLPISRDPSMSFWVRAPLTCLKNLPMGAHRLSLYFGESVYSVGKKGSSPLGEIFRAQSSLSPNEFGSCVTRIPLKRIQELRARHGQWAVCNRALSAAMRYVDKLLVSREGEIRPKWSIREIKQTYVDFWDSPDAFRIQS